MGDRIDLGNYTLVRRIAVSGMSEVHLATGGPGPLSGRQVVVKILLEDVAGIQQFRTLFENEARLASAMAHPNIVRFLDHGESDGRPFLVMEHVDGLDLQRLLRRSRRSGDRLPPAQGVYVVLRVLEALEYLHALADESGHPLNIIHRDVSPSNILLSMDSEVKLGDFGIAYSEQGGIESLSRKFKGKVHYLSPEQVRGDPVDLRSDLYSAGVVLAELMLGRKPFEGASDLSILINVRDGHSPAMEEGLRTLPPGLAAVMERALATNPADRFPDASAFRRDLGACIDPKRTGETVLGLSEAVRSARKLFGTTGRPPKGSKAPTFNLVQALSMSSPVDGYAEGAAGAAAPGSASEQADEETDRSQATPVRRVMHYVVKRSEGKVLGSVPLSELIHDIVCDRIGEDDLVSVDGSEFRSVSSIPDLSKHLPSVTPTEKRHDLGLPDKRGILSEHPVARIFIDLYRAGETGLLLFECSGIRKEVRLENGVPRYVSSNLAGDLLGEFLVREGTISRMELDMALAVMDKYEGRLGDTLLGLDIVDSITLLRAITRQIKARLFDVFAWTNGEYHFYREAHNERESFRLTSPALELIREGCMHALEREDVEAWLRANGSRIVALSPRPEFPIGDWHLSPSYSSLMEALSRPAAVEEVVRPFEHASAEVRCGIVRVLLFGIHVGLLEIMDARLQE